MEDNRECATCGRFREGEGCGDFVDTCMQDHDAYSNWIKKEEPNNGMA